MPARRWGPWDYRKVKKADLGESLSDLWTPDKPAGKQRGVTREEVARHNTLDDCWIIVAGKVYDITEWAPHHPGGAGIARMYAGKESTAQFGDYHSAEAVAHLVHFLVGDLVDA